MQIDIATLFPEMCDAVLQESILGRAQKSGAISVQCWNIRDYTLNKHKRVDDVPYGGGRGMVMQADPIYRCWEAVCAERVQTALYLSFPERQRVHAAESGCIIAAATFIFALWAL